MRRDPLCPDYEGLAAPRVRAFLVECVATVACIAGAALLAWVMQ